VAVRDGTDAAGHSAAGAQRIARPALAQAIALAFDEGSVLLVAGAGYGKSMALEEAIAVAGRRAVWLSCAEADGDAGRLLLTAVERLRAAVPGLADVVGDRLAAGVEPVDVRAAGRALLGELEGLLVEPLVIVFDDAEQIADSEAGLGWISQLLGIERVPLSVAVASRRSLPLKLAKLRAAGRLREFGPAELSFSASECGEALRLRAGRPLDEHVEAVMTATEGWPLGVALAGLADSDRPANAVVPRDHLFGYLAEEVLERLERNARAALIDSSVPAVLTPDLAEALGLPSDFLVEIERQALFLRPHVSGAGARAYHPLFREFLLERLNEERTEAEREALHARVAAKIAAAGRIAEAIEHWLDAGCGGDALAALASGGQELLRTSPDAVREWLTRLPADLHQTPAYLLLEGQLAWGAGQHEDALAPLRAAVEGFQQTGAEEPEWLARAVLVDALISVGSFDEVVEEAEGWDRPLAQRARMTALGVAWYKVLALALGGQGGAARQLADELNHDPQAAGRFRYVEDLALLASDLPGGRGHAAVERLRATISALELDDPGGRIPYALAAIVVACLDIGARLEAFGWLERYLRESERVGLGFVARDAHLQRAFLLAREGDLSSAELELAQAGSRRGTGWRGLNRPKAEAQVAALRGDRAEAVAAAERAIVRARPGPVFFRVAAAADMAPVLAENGAAELARAAVADVMSALDDQFPGEQGRYHRARLLATRAWLEFEGGEREAAYESLRSCWGQAGQEGDQLARAHWSELRPVLWQALADGELEPSLVLPSVESAFPDASALIELTDHPQPDVRGAALSAALASSHPAVLDRLEQLTGDGDQQVASAALAARERLRRDPPPLRFELLGRFRVMRAGWEIGEGGWERPMAARVVRFLLVSGPSAVPEDVLFEAFWADRPADAARQQLAVALSRGRKLLDLPGAERSLVEVSERTYRLRLRERDSVDAFEFDEAAGAALAESGAGRRASLERAAVMWTGEPLPEDRYSPWSFAWRDRLTERYAQVLSGMIELSTASGDHAGTIRTARDLLELDPLNEEAHRQLMVAYARTGRTNYALRQYLECRRALISELGVEPAARTSRLQSRILAGEAI
jgi:ATP/maltotriose-dependent transcriptional regulator MalT/DNA-binding SARP family transcriptional activator